MASNNLLEIVDKHLQSRIEMGLNRLPIETIQPEMADPEQNPADKWKTWFPIKSNVTDTELNELEETIGFPFPGSYREFLKHKHFYELSIGEASFCRHEANLWGSSQTGIVFDSYPREFLIDKGYIPFAVWSDWGVLCFNTHANGPDNEYPVILWDHERWNNYAPFATDFKASILQLDAGEMSTVNAANC